MPNKKVELKEIELHLVGISKNRNDLKNVILKTFEYLFVDRTVSFSNITETFFVDLNGYPSYRVICKESCNELEIIEVEEV